MSPGSTSTHRVELQALDVGHGQHRRPGGPGVPLPSPTVPVGQSRRPARRSSASLGRRHDHDASRPLAEHAPSSRADGVAPRRRAVAAADLLRDRRSSRPRGPTRGVGASMPAAASTSAASCMICGRRAVVDGQLRQPPAVVHVAVEHLAPRARAGRRAGLRDVADQRHRPGRAAAHQQPPRHRRELLRLVDDHVAVGPGAVALGALGDRERRTARRRTGRPSLGGHAWQPAHRVAADLQDACAWRTSSSAALRGRSARPRSRRRCRPRRAARPPRRAAARRPTVHGARGRGAAGARSGGATGRGAAAASRPGPRSRSAQQPLRGQRQPGQVQLAAARRAESRSSATQVVAVVAGQRRCRSSRPAGRPAWSSRSRDERLAGLVVRLAGCGGPAPGRAATSAGRQRRRRWPSTASTRAARRAPAGGRAPRAASTSAIRRSPLSAATSAAARARARRRPGRARRPSTARRRSRRATAAPARCSAGTSRSGRRPARRAAPAARGGCRAGTPRGAARPPSCRCPARPARRATPARSARMTRSCSAWMVATMSPIRPVRCAPTRGQQRALAGQRAALRARSIASRSSTSSSTPVTLRPRVARCRRRTTPSGAAAVAW